MTCMKMVADVVPTRSLALAVAWLLCYGGAALAQAPLGVAPTYACAPCGSAPVYQGFSSSPWQSGYTIGQSRGLSIGGFRSRVLRPLGSPMTTYATYAPGTYASPCYQSGYSAQGFSSYADGMTSFGGTGYALPMGAYGAPVASDRCITIMVCPGY